MWRDQRDDAWDTKSRPGEGRPLTEDEQARYREPVEIWQKSDPDAGSEAEEEPRRHRVNAGSSADPWSEHHLCQRFCWPPVPMPGQHRPDPSNDRPQRSSQVSRHPHVSELWLGSERQRTPWHELHMNHRTTQVSSNICSIMAHMLPCSKDKLWTSSKCIYIHCSDDGDRECVPPQMHKPCV